MELIFALWAALSEIRVNFQNCHIWVWDLAFSQSSRSRSCTSMYTFFLPQGSKLTLFLLYRKSLLRYWTYFKIAILGHETWPLAKFHKLHIYSLSTPKGLKLSLLSLCGQRFPRYRRIIKIAIFGHETWLLANVPELAHIFPKVPLTPHPPPPSQNFTPFCSMAAHFQDIGHFCEDCHTCHREYD